MTITNEQAWSTSGPMVGRQVESRERSRRQIVGLVFAFFWILILEGVARKWIAPGLQNVIYFARDPIVIAIYVIAFSRGFVPRGGLLMGTGVLIAILALGIVVLQMMDPVVQVPAFLIAFGWRSYFAYMFLPFIMMTTFREEDVQRLLKYFLWTLPPMALLMAVQAQFPGSHWINMGFGSGADSFGNLGVAFGIVRPHGTFTSDLVSKIYVAAAAALVLGLWIIPRSRRPVGQVWLWVFTLSVLIGLGVCGGRGAYVHVGMIMLAGLFGAAVSRGAVAAGRALLLMALMIGLFLVVVTNFFPVIFDALMARWQGAYKLEQQAYYGGVVGRAVLDLVAFVPLMDDVPVIGYGLGLGTNAATRLGIVPSHLPFMESDWSRHMVDLGPIVGLMFVLWRIAVVVYLGWKSIMVSRLTRLPLPVLVFAFLLPLFLYFQITGQGQMQAFGWLFFGVNLALIQIYTQKYRAAQF